MEIQQNRDGIKFSDDYGDVIFKNEKELMDSIRIVKHIFIPARQCGISLQAASDFLDSMRYAYNDILTTNEYINNLPKQLANPNLLINSNLKIVKVIFNEPATIVFWNDGSKTIVKCAKDEIFDPEKGLAMAVCKKLMGYTFRNTFKKFVPEEEIALPKSAQTKNYKFFILGEK